MHSIFWPKKINFLKIMKMNKSLVLLVVLVLAALFIFGCTRGGGNYQAGYAAYNQPVQQGGGYQGGYVGGGCAVAGPDSSGSVDISQPSAAA